MSVKTPTPAIMPITSTPQTTRIAQMTARMTIYLISDLTKDEIVLAFLLFPSNRWVINVATKIIVIAIKTKMREMTHFLEPLIMALPKTTQPLATPSPNKASPVSLPNTLLASIKRRKPTRERAKIVMPIMKLTFWDLVFLCHQLPFLTSTIFIPPL